jgi:hypothetical protein
VTDDLLTIDSFRPHEGTTFVLHATAEHRVDLTLAGVRALGPGSHGSREPFALDFRGPADAPVLAQMTYRLTHEQVGEQEIFLVPVGVTPAGADYEAIFT